MKVPLAVACLALIVGGMGAAGAAAEAQSRSERKAAAAAAMVPAGEPQDCVELTQIRSTEVIDDSTIDFRLRGGQVLRNRLPSACPGLGFEERFSYATSLSRLCSVDIITVLRGGMSVAPGASCGLGKFQPMTKAAR